MKNKLYEKLFIALILISIMKKGKKIDFELKIISRTELIVLLILIFLVFLSIFAKL